MDISTLKTFELILDIATPIIVIGGFALLKFNDFRHMQNDLNSIFKQLSTLNKNVNKIDKQVAVLEQRTDTLEKNK